MDAGASEVNILNRLHFMVAGARGQMASEEETMSVAKVVRRFTIPQVWPRELYVFNNYASLESKVERLGVRSGAVGKGAKY
jgi:hypothetical protein